MGVSQPRVSRCLRFAQEKIKKELSKQQKGFEVGALGLALLPLDPLLSQVLHQEAAAFDQLYFAFTPEMIDGAAAIAGGTAAAAATAAAAGGIGANAGGTATSSFAGVVTTVAAVVAVSVGVLIGAPHMQSPPEPAPAVSVEYSISFTGGAAGQEYLNPSRASAQANTKERGEMKALGWKITADGNEAVLYSGKGDVVEAALVQMRSEYGNGSYILSFNMEDGVGDTWTLSRMFMIETTP